jgi:mono/diheme cytochrome c family protein
MIQFWGSRMGTWRSMVNSTLREARAVLRQTKSFLGWAFESVVDVGYAVGVDAGDDGRVGIDVAEIDGLDEGCVRLEHSFVHGAVEGDGDLQVNVRVGAIAASFEAGDDVVAGDDLFFEDGVGAVDAVEEVVGRGLSVGAGSCARDRCESPAGAW